MKKTAPSEISTQPTFPDGFQERNNEKLNKVEVTSEPESFRKRVLKEKIEFKEASLKEKTRPRFNPFIIFIIIIWVVILPFLAFFLVSYIKQNFTPDAILKTALMNVKNEKHIKYDTDIKMAFSYANKDEKINVSDMEVYSLLTKSSSDKYEIKLTGEHDWKEATPSGNFILNWNIDDKKIFALDSNYRGQFLNYKVTPYEYVDLVEASTKETYSRVDLQEILGRMLSQKTFNEVNNLQEGDIDFIVLESFPDDIIESEKTYHYKIHVSFKGEMERLLSGIYFDDSDIWIGKQSKMIKKVKTSFEIKDIGSAGNNMNINLESKLSY